MREQLETLEIIESETAFDLWFLFTVSKGPSNVAHIIADSHR